MGIIQRKYSSLLNVLLLLWTIVQVLSIMQKLYSNIDNPIVYVFLLLDIVLLIGLVLVHQLKKRGFSLVVLALGIQLFLSFVLPFTMVDYLLKSFFCLGLFLLLMGVKCKKTGLNGYQTLGLTFNDNKKAEVKANSFSEKALAGDAHDNSQKNYVAQNKMRKEAPEAEASNEGCQVNRGKTIKDFIDDWKIDVKNESAMHFSGLGFRHVKKGCDGRENIEISGWVQWAIDYKDKGYTIEQRKKMQNQLYYEFVAIYKQFIIPRKHIMYLQKIDESN